jgi:hypothetical protein
LSLFGFGSLGTNLGVEVNLLCIIHLVAGPLAIDRFDSSSILASIKAEAAMDNGCVLRRPRINRFDKFVSGDLSNKWIVFELQI